jgi:hypothetical protein
MESEATEANESVAERWRRIEASLPPEQLSRQKTREGRIRPYRPCPPDFRERYIEMGWHVVDEHYRAHWRTIARWIDETGRQELKEARTAYVQARGNILLHPNR